MKTVTFLLWILSTLLPAPFLCAQSKEKKHIHNEKEYAHLLTPVKRNVIYQAKKPLVMDGKAKETDWEQIQWMDDFEDIEGALKPKPLYRTRVKMLHDTASLYILVELQEPHIWATYDRHDMIIYHENDFEIFIDPDGDTHNYFEYELNALNTLLDLKMPMPYRNGGKADISWNSKGFQSAVSIDGTLNDPSDTDNKWTIEMKIPFADLQVHGVPKDGQIWKINFSRVEWQTQAIDGKYEKIKNPSTGRAYPEYNWVWSPPGLINMHYPERWGMIQFSGKKTGSSPGDFKMPGQEEAARYLWLAYYKQQDFKRKNNRYATSFEELNIPPPALIVIQKINLTATDQQFTIKALLKGSAVISIDEKGLFHTTQK